MTHRILVTPRSLTESPHPAIERMRSLGLDIVYASAGRQPDEAELLRLIPGIAGWIAGVEPVTEAVIARADSLRCISRNGTGIDNLPLPALKARNITLRTAGGANAQGVAELAIAMVFAALRHVPHTDQGIKAGQWPRKRGLEIRGRKLGVVGCGAVGREVVRLGLGIGARVLAYDPLRPALPEVTGDLQWASLDEVFRQAEIITLHCPSPADGQALVDAARLQDVQPGLILINTARASLVDEVALAAALDARRVATYCVDVFDPEPPRLPGLASRPDVIATSHIGGYTAESVDRATEFAVANLLESLNIREAAP